MAHPYHAECKAAEAKRLHRASGGSVKSVAEREAVKAVHAHEKHDHKGEKPTENIFGKAGKPRLDRKARAEGGRTKGKGKGTEVNIIVAPGGDHAPTPAPAAAPVAPPPAPPVMARPPMMPPPGAMAGGPPGAPPGVGMPPPPMRKRGGKVGKYDAGAGSGRGRLEKAAEYGAKA